MEFARVFVVLVYFLVCSSAARIRRQWSFEDDTCRTPDGSTGICVNLNNCRVISDFINRSDAINDETKQILRKYVCKNDGRGNVKVCCPSKLPDFATSRGGVDHSRHRNYNLLPKRCGMSATSQRIINGNKTSLFEYPWAVALKYDINGIPYQCGASLISNRYILTAAHCIRSTYKLIGVRLGEHNFDTNPDCDDNGLETVCADPPQDFDISSSDATVHPQYNSNTYQNDIALIRLRTRANTNIDSVLPVCLPITASEKTRKYSDYTVIGWGATENRFASPLLLQVKVPKIENAKCAPLYSSRTKLTEKQFCAGGKNEQDSCPGDSGGPLMAEFADEGIIRTIQYGIVSLGPSICGREGFPTLYTRVDQYVGWILDNIRS